MKITGIHEINPGKIQGYIENGLKIFKGIPYAEPPVGKLRFLPPEPKQNWNGIFDATNFSPHAIQPPPLPAGALQQINFPKSEDSCLSLNIWTPALEGKLPVMVWIHGGDFVGGGTRTVMYDGAKLATRGNVVLVTINYRLGVFGFLNIKGVTANAGLLDQIEALKWVNENIRKFGGDPDNVTIFGESAGACSVITLSAMPAAKGLFHRVISESLPYYYATDGEKATEELMKELGIDIGDINSLRKLSAKKLLAAQIKIYMGSNSVTATNPWIPQVDNKTLPQDPLSFFSNGKSDVELLIGTNLNENKLFSIMDPHAPNLDINRVNKRLSRLMKIFNQKDGKINDFLNAYMEERQENNFSNNPRDLYDNITTDLWFRILSIRLAEAQSRRKSSYMYLFTWESPLTIPNHGKLGAAHAVEIPFVFGSLDQPGMNIFVGSGAEANRLSENMMDSWIAFAKTGSPNHRNIPEWNTYTSKSRRTMILGKEITSANDPYSKTRLIWNGVF
ncbi:MAG: carboxylesterase/lipase family protein [Promethearchaeota archaeon]